MEVKEAIAVRRAYRSLGPVDISLETIRELAEAAQLTMSCYNHQPWRFVFVRDVEMLKRMHSALAQGNEWATEASLIVAVFAKREDDCLIKEREYFLFDTGMATAFMVLRATELGLVAHPIAGYSPAKTREILSIPDEYQVITLVIVGKKTDTIGPKLTAQQVQLEATRPPRIPLAEMAFLDRYGEGIS
ncbi:MAG: nitroreductase family protein [Smithellaceae bacterium]|nr:nitroreductase family protein [Smithellaceae bacterium]